MIRTKKPVSVSEITVMKETNSAWVRNQPHYIAFLFIAWLILIIPLIDTKIIPGHDYVFHVSRILNIADGLREGVFPLRVYADNEIFWGTPLGIFYPCLFLYIPALLNVAGLPIEICYNLFISLTFLVGLLSSWQGFSLLTRSKTIGLFSAIFYISSGYYLSDAYIRSAVGELMGLSVMPLAIACIQAVITKTKVTNKICILGFLSVSAVIQSHVLSSFFLVLFTLVNLFWRYKNVTASRVYRILLFFVFLVFLNANFILPFLFFYKSVPVLVDYVENFSKYGWSTIIIMRFFVLWNFWLLVAVYFFLCLFRRKSFLFLRPYLLNSYYKAYFPCFLTGLAFIFMSDYMFPWDILLPLELLFETMQFPWRFLGLSTLCFSVCGGLTMGFILRTKHFNNAIVFLSVCFICIANVAAFYNFSPLPSSARWQMPAKLYWERNLSPSYTDYLYKDMKINELLVQGDRYISDAIIRNFNKKGTTISFSYNAKQNSEITLPLLKYPGYTAEDQTGKKIVIGENDNHMILIKLPKGTGTVKVWYKGLVLFTVSDYLTLFTVAGLMFCLYCYYWRKDKKDLIIKKLFDI